MSQNDDGWPVGTEFNGQRFDHDLITIAALLKGARNLAGATGRTEVQAAAQRALDLIELTRAEQAAEQVIDGPDLVGDEVCALTRDAVMQGFRILERVEAQAEEGDG